MKQFFYTRKSKLLLFMLLAFFAGGVSPTWAETLTETFDKVTVTSRYLLSNGWIMVHNNGNYQGFGGSYDYQIKSGNYDGEIGNSLYCSYSDNNEYVVIPTKLTGTFTYYAKRAESSDGTITFFEATKSGDTFTVTSTQLATTSTSNSWGSKSFNIGTDGKYVAIRLLKSRIDQISATIFEETTGPAFVVKDGSTKLTSPYAYNFGLTTTGTTKVFTLSNPGTEATPISVDVTGANGFTATVQDNATSIPAGGEKPLTITMPDATTSGSIVVTPTGDGLNAFTFNVSGTIRDPNKVYLDFSDSQIPDGWTWVATGSYASSYPCSVHEGYVSWCQYGGSDYAWALTSPKLTFTNGELIAFETAKYGDGGYSNYTPSVTVEYSLDGNAWTAIGSAFTDDTYGNWTKRSVNIPVDGVKYIRFNGWYIHMRNIYGGELPLNPTPKDFAYSSVANTSAQLSWTSTATNFNIQYKANGAGDWTTLSNITANPYTLSGLTAATTYQVKIQADHGVNGLSDYTEPISFTTKPDPISAYPYTENFNSLSSGEIPQYWDNSEGTTTNASYKWVYNASGNSGACVRFESDYNSNGKTNFLKTRPFNFTEGKPMKLSFWYKNAKGGDFSVYASTDGGSTYPTALTTGLTGKNDWTLKEIDIPAAIYGSNVVIVFKGTSNYATGGNIFLDDVTISEVPDYSMTISGTDVNENTIAFGSVKNTTTTKTFTITNDGGEDLTGISVVSSDATVFTVSDTDFDLASGATKDITVTFVKGVAGDYSKTITISQANVASDKVLTVTGTYVAPDPATIAVKLGGSAVGASVAFGTVGKAKSKTFTVENTGEVALDITSIASSNTTDFIVSPATLTVAGGETGEFTVTFAWDGDALDAEKTANITVTPSNAGLDPVVFAVTGTRVDMWSEDFSGNAKPEGWEAGTNWSFSDGVAKAAYEYGTTTYLTTPALTIAGTTDEMSFDYQATSNYVSIKIQKSKDGGAFTDLHTISGLNNGDAGTYTITGLETGTYKFRFANDDYQLDNFEGFKLCADNPTIAVKDAENADVASGTTKDFGWAQTAQSATYKISNSGTGTLTISNISAPDGFTATTAGDVMTVAAGADPLVLTVTMTNAAIGAKSGTVTLTTDGGNFEIPVKGFIYGDRNLVDFTDATQYTGWTGVNVTDNVASLSSTAIETTPFAATAGEKLYVEIKGNSSYTTHSFSYSYSRDGGANWSDATALVASTNSSVPDQVFTITDIADAEAASTVLIRFTGAGLGINRIYGFEALTAPVMTLDKTADYNFGMQTADAEYVITVTNTGTATLNNLAAALTTGTNYSVAITKPDGESTTTISAGKATVPAGQQAIITVTQLFDANNGLASLSDVLTISGDDVASQVINLSGQTRDGSKWYVDFASGIPSTFVEKGNWSYSSQQAYVYTESALVSQTLTLAANEKVQFDAKKMSYGVASLKIRHSLNGGLSWSDYTDLTDTEGFNSSAYKTMEYGVGNTDASTVAMIEFLGANVYLDNIYGGTLNNEAPMIQVKKGSTIVASGVSHEFGSILAEATAEYTIKNIGGGTLTITSPITTVTGGASATVNETSLGAGESATLTITMTPAEPYGEKSGAVTVKTSLGDFVINYTATTMNPNTLNVDFSDYTLPTGWYADGWTCEYTQYLSRSNRTSDTNFITQKLNVAGTSDVLKFDAQKFGSYYASSTVLKVSYSTDRVNWTEIGNYASEMTTSWKTFEISGLAAGEYYLKFTGRYANVDNIIGWTKVAGIDHDLYVTATSFPATTDLGDDATITATVTSLRANETGVYAKLLIDGAEEATSTTAQDINLNASKTFSFTYAIPENKTAQIKVYFSDNTEAFATASNNMKVRYAFDEEVDPNTIAAGTFEVNMDRTFVAGWNTICLPFDINVTDIHAEAKAFSFDAYDEGTKALTFNKVTTTLEAGKPYVIYVPEEITTALQFNGAAITATEAGKSEHTMTFQGTYAPMAAGSLTSCCGLTASGKIAKAKSTTTMKGFRGYFMNVPAGARVMFNGFDDDETTGIRMITIDNTAAEGTYNLQGQKVEQLKKGRLYIINGKKQVVK